LDFTNPNGQVDLRRIWMQTAKSTTNNDLWLYFAWERDKDTGSGFISFEFQQNQLSSACVYTGTGIDQVLPQSPQETALINNCNPWAGRSAGDFLILWDQQGSGLNITKRVFTLVGGVLTLGPVQSLGSVVAAISADGFTGEAAINLTRDVFPPTGQCVNFANIIPGTVTGNSDTADYKDTVLAAFPDISNCGSLTVTKVTEPVTNPADATSFSYKVDRVSGQQVIINDGNEINGAVAHGELDEYHNLLAGTDFRLHEGAVSGYDLKSITCVQGTNTWTQSTNDLLFSIVAGDTTACTITNGKRQGTLRVIKHVINDNGGQATASQFLMSLNDGSTADFNGAEGTFGPPATGGTIFTFDEGHAFNVTESLGALAGKYSASQQGTCSGTIAAGVEKVCMITNNDITATLIVIKHVINNNGGTKTAANFTMNVTATNPSSSSFPGAESSGTTITLDAGSYSVTENAVDGYEQVSAVGCSGTIANGETKTCTITNDDKAATLIVIKHVILNNGGTGQASDFTMTINGVTASGGNSFPGAETPGTSKTLTTVGSYSVTETGPSGFDASYSADCTGTIALGETKTCTVTNDDTKASPGGETVMAQVLHDKLNIHNIRAGGGAVTVTFKLYSDVNCAVEIGTAAEQTANAGRPVTVVGTEGSASTGAGVLVTTTGSYRWRAFFSGNTNNNAFDTACGSEISGVTFTYPPQ